MAGGWLLVLAILLVPGTGAGLWYSVPSFLRPLAAEQSEPPCPLNASLHAVLLNNLLESYDLSSLGWCGLILPAIEVLAICGMIIGTWLCFKMRTRVQNTTFITPPNTPLKNAAKDGSTTVGEASWSPHSPIVMVKEFFTPKPELHPPSPQPERAQRDVEKESAEKVIRERVEGMYEIEGSLCDIGSRTHKFAMSGKFRSGDSTRLLFTICPVSNCCTFKFPKYTTQLNTLLATLAKECSAIHPIREIIYSDETNQLILVQPFVQSGSLKDVIYGAKPNRLWEKKYAKRSKGLSVDKVALYGSQVLEGLLYLYEKGFPPLGHVQSGNVFVHTDGDCNEVCKLGGYENTLLGYRSRLYKRYYKDYLEHIDVLMFGHLVFEMAAGYELVTVSPTEKDYKQFAGNTKILPDLIFIFSQVDIGNCPTIKDIHKRLFFRTDVLSPRHEDTTVPREKDDLLKLLHKKPAGNKPRPAKATKPKPPLPRSHSIASTSTRPPDSDRGLEPKDGGFQGVPLSASSREQSSSLGRLNGETTKMQALKQDMKEFRKDLKARAKTAGKVAKGLGNDLKAKLNYATWSLKKKELKPSVSLGDLSAAQQ